VKGEGKVKTVRAENFKKNRIDFGIKLVMIGP